VWQHARCNINPLNAELNPICHLLALLGAHHIFHVSGLRFKNISVIFTKLNLFSILLEISFMIIDKSDTSGLDIRYVNVNNSNIY
jgi:hypothetical protein